MTRSTIQFALLLTLSIALPVRAMTLANTFDAENNPDVAFARADAPEATGVYLVAWEHQLSMANVDVMGRLVGEDGAALGPAFTLAGDGVWERYPAVASNGSDEFLVVFERDDGAGDHDIYGQRVSTSGALLGNRFAISADAKYESQPVVAYDSTHDDYVVIWEHFHSATDIDIHGRVVAGDGTLASTFVVAESGRNERDPDVASEINGSGFLVTFDYPDHAGDIDLLAQPLTVNHDLSVQLQPNASFFVRAGAGDDQSSSVAGGYSGQYFVAWHDVHHGQDRAMGRLVSSSGSLGWVEHIGSSSTWSGPQPDVMAHATGGYTVVWDAGTTDSDIKARDISIYGLLDGAVTTVSADSRGEYVPAVPQVVSVGSPLVVWALEYSCFDYDIHAELLP